MEKAILGFLYFYAFSATLSMGGASIGIYGALLLGIIQYFRSPVKPKVNKGLLTVIAFFGVSSLLSIFGAHNRLDALVAIWRDFYRFASLFLVLFFVKDQQQRYTLLFTLFLSVAISDIVAIYQGLHGNYRAAAFTDNPLRLAGMLIQTIPFFLVFGLQDRNLPKKVRIGLIGLSVVTLVALFYNGTRGAWLALGFTLALYGIIYLRKNIKLLLLASLLLVCLVGTMMNNPSIRARVYSIGTSNDHACSERYLLWQSALQMFYDHPVTGVGYGNFGYWYKKEYMSPKALMPWLTHAHNSYLHVLAENGLIGIIAFLSMLGFILYRLYRYYRKNPNDPWAMSGLLMVIVWMGHAFTEYNFGSAAVMRMFWVELGLVMLEIEAVSGKEAEKPVRDEK